MFSDPQKIVAECGIQVGMEIADLGVGSGFYAFAVARALISTGRVYAVDIQKDLLTKIKNQAVSQGLYNVEVIWGDLEKPSGTHLRDSSIDLAFLTNILFQLDDKVAAMAEVKRILKPGGSVLVVEWSDSFGGIGPEPKKILLKNTTTEMFEKNGFHLVREITAGDHHYGLIFKKL
jgi:ubiquinone/menaquinone biosynthesis C-methylase UbiE